MAESSVARVKTTGMHCQSCAMLVRMNVEEIDGVSAVEVDVPTGTTVVTYDPAVASTDKIVAAIESAGYGATLE